MKPQSKLMMTKYANSVIRLLSDPYKFSRWKDQWWYRFGKYMIYAAY